MGILTPTRKPRFHSRRSSNSIDAGSHATRAVTRRATAASSSKCLQPSRIRTIAAAVAAVASIAAIAFPAHATATAVAFYMPGTSPHPASSGTVDVAAIGAAANGWITQAQQVGYPASLQPAVGTMALDASVAQGVANLAAAIATVPTTTSILLFGVSQGDIVLTYEEQALAAAEHPNNITFFRIADPSGPTGIMGRNAGLLLPGISFVRAPADSPYNTIAVVHQYDVFADWPAQQLNLLADLNAIAGGLLFHNYAGYNIDLSTLPASDITTTVNSRGATTTTYFIRNTGLLPILTLAQNAGVNPKIVNALQPILKPIIDSAYAPQPNRVFMAQKIFQATVKATITAAFRVAGAIRATQAALTTTAARLTRPVPSAPGRAPAATARKTAAALPRPGAKTPPPQPTSSASTGAADLSRHQRTTRSRTEAVVSPKPAPRTARVPAPNGKQQ